MTLKRWMRIVSTATMLIALVLVAVLIWLYLLFRSSSEEYALSIAPAQVSSSDLVAEMFVSDRSLRDFATVGDMASRSQYVRTNALVDSGFNQIAGLGVLDPEVVEKPQSTFADYSATVGNPALELADAGQGEAALALMNTRESEALFNQMIAEAANIRFEADVMQRESFEELQRLLLLFTTALGVAIALLLAGPLLTYWAMYRFVLSPLQAVRDDVARATNDAQHKAVITARGRAELSELASDAEEMRRKLVQEIDDAQAAREAMEQEVPLVAAIARELTALTEANPSSLLLAGHQRAKEGVLAGDFWDCVVTADGRVALVICDVAGHGVDAGVHAMRLKTTISLGLEAGFPPETLMTRCAAGFTNAPGRFATCAMVILDPVSGEIEWLTAGHPLPRLVTPNGVERLETTGPLLSMLGGSWRSRRMFLPEDATVVMVTDGILENRDEQGSELGDEGLDSLLMAQASSSGSSEDYLTDLLAHGRQWAADWDRDDITMVVFRRKKLT